MPLSILQGIRFSRNCLLPPAPLPPIISGSNWERFNAPLNAATPAPPPRPLENTLLKTALLGTWSSIEGQLCKTSWSVATLRHNPATNFGVLLVCLNTHCGVSFLTKLTPLWLPCSAVCTIIVGPFALRSRGFAEGRWLIVLSLVNSWHSQQTQSTIFPLNQMMKNPRKVVGKAWRWKGRRSSCLSDHGSVHCLRDMEILCTILKNCFLLWSWSHKR